MPPLVWMRRVPESQQVSAGATVQDYRLYLIVADNNDMAQDKLLESAMNLYDSLMAGKFVDVDPEIDREYWIR